MWFKIFGLRSCFQGFLCSFILLVPDSSHGQAQQMVQGEPRLPPYYRQHQAYLSDVKTGMYVLSGWGLATSVGSVYILTQSSTSKYERGAFGQMSLTWGAVNLGVGLIGLYRTNKLVKALERQRDVYLPDSVRAAALAEVYRAHSRAFGIALMSDAICAGLGGALATYGPRGNKSVNDDQINQLGYAILYQSIGLGIFDGFLYLHTTGEQNKLKPYFSPAPSGIGMVYHF